MTTAAARGFVALASTGVALLGVFAWFQLREEPETTFVDSDDSAFDELLEERAGAEPVTANEHEPEASYPPALIREPVDPKRARGIFATLRQKGWEYDPVLYFRRTAHQDRWQRFAEHPAGGWTVKTNDFGMRNDADVLAEKPDLRVLTTGDSHIDGAVGNDESLPYFLGERLRDGDAGRSVESLNAGAGSYGPYNYLGVIERYGPELAPDVYVVVLYGGNDFTGTMRLQRFFHKRDRMKTEPFVTKPLRKAKGGMGGIDSQELFQVVYFLNNPEDVQIAIDTNASLAIEIERVCAENGTLTIFVYLPPPLAGQAHHFDHEIQPILELLPLEMEDIRVSDRIADGLLAFLESRGMHTLDLRPIFEVAKERFYWERDHHLNVAGHAAAAEALAPIVEELLAE